MKTNSPVSRRRLAASLAACLAVVSASASFGGEPVAVNKLPETVTKAISEKHKDAELLSAEHETDKGQNHYEVKVRSGGKVYELDVSPDGKIIKSEIDN